MEGQKRDELWKNKVSRNVHTILLKIPNALSSINAMVAVLGQSVARTHRKYGMNLLTEYMPPCESILRKTVDPLWRISANVGLYSYPNNDKST